MTEPKFCTDCKHYSFGLAHHMCAAPPHKINLVDGKREPEFADLRRKYGPCGPSAVMFEAAPPKPAYVMQHIHPQPKRWWEFWK